MSMYNFWQLSRLDKIRMGSQSVSTVNKSVIFYGLLKIIEITNFFAVQLDNFVNGILEKLPAYHIKKISVHSQSNLLAVLACH